MNVLEGQVQARRSGTCGSAQNERKRYSCRYCEGRESSGVGAVQANTYQERMRTDVSMNVDEEG